MWIGPVEIVKLEGKSVFVSDTTEVVKLNASQIIPIKINHPAEDEGLDNIVKYSDQVEKERQKDVQVFLTEIRMLSTTRTPELAVNMIEKQ